MRKRRGTFSFRKKKRSPAPPKRKPIEGKIKIHTLFDAIPVVGIAQWEGQSGRKAPRLTVLGGMILGTKGIAMPKRRPCRLAYMVGKVVRFVPSLIRNERPDLKRDHRAEKSGQSKRGSNWLLALPAGQSKRGSSWLSALPTSWVSALSEKTEMEAAMVRSDSSFSYLVN